MKSFFKLCNIVATLVAVLMSATLFVLATKFILLPIASFGLRYAGNALDALRDDNMLYFAYSACQVILVVSYQAALILVLSYLSWSPYLALRRLRAKWRVRHAQPSVGLPLSPKERTAQMARMAPQLAHERSKVTVAAAVEAAKRRRDER